MQAFVACAHFRGKDSGNLLQLFRDSLQELYDRQYDIDAEQLSQPEDFYTALSEAIETAWDSHSAAMNTLHTLYLFEFDKIVKIGGIHSPYACIEWPGIQIPQAILGLLEEKGLVITFYNDKREVKEHTQHFYERNPLGQGLDFDDHPDDKINFVRYAVELRCLNPIMDTKKSPLPQLEDLAEAVEALMAAGLKPNKEPRKELEKLLQAGGTARHWFAEPRGPCIRDIRINSHLGAARFMTLGRIQDPEGAKLAVVSFKTAAGAILVVQRHTYKIISFRDTDNGRLRVNKTTTIGGKQDMNKQGRRVILIYKAHMYTEASLDPERCPHKSDEKARRNSIQTHLRQIDQYEDIGNPVRDQQEDDTIEYVVTDT